MEKKVQKCQFPAWSVACATVRTKVAVSTKMCIHDANVQEGMLSLSNSQRDTCPSHEVIPCLYSALWMQVMAVIMLHAANRLGFLSFATGCLWCGTARNIIRLKLVPSDVNLALFLQYNLCMFRVPIEGHRSEAHKGFSDKAVLLWWDQANPTKVLVAGQ